MSGWQPIDTAPRETGRPLLLYPYPYHRGKALHSPQPSDRPMLHVNDSAVRRFIKRAKKWGYVTSDELNEIMPPRCSPRNRSRMRSASLPRWASTSWEETRLCGGWKTSLETLQSAREPRTISQRLRQSLRAPLRVISSSIAVSVRGIGTATDGGLRAASPVSQHTGCRCPRRRWLSSASDGSQTPVPDVCSPVEHHLILHWIDPVLDGRLAKRTEPGSERGSHSYDVDFSHHGWAFHLRDL